MRKKSLRIGIAIAALLLGQAAIANSGSVKQYEPKVMYVDCRTEVRTLSSLKSLARSIAEKGMNAILMEYDATFPFEKHATLRNQFAYTKEEIKEFVSYCSNLGVDVIPLQNCIGHCEYILRHERYSALREDDKDPSQVCPLKVDKAVTIFREIFEEVAALHPSQYFHIGADETYLLGKCKDCSDYAQKYGKSNLFIQYVKAMCQIVMDMGKTPIMWADIALAYPEAVSELPKELILVDWNYGWDVNRFGSLDNLFNAGIKLWGATALRSAPDNIYLTQWEKHFNNLATFVPFAREHGYTGLVQTSWSTSGTYGFHYDASNEIVNMQPIRLVYPESGFNILIAATAKAFNQDEPLDPESFVKEYAAKQYGFNQAQAQVLWDYFKMPQETVSAKTGKSSSGATISQVLSVCRQQRTAISTLKAKANRHELEHYVLMLDIRINYLEFKEIESIFESENYDLSLSFDLFSRLQRICQESRALDRRFRKLNKNYLKQGEIDNIISFRRSKQEDLLTKLSCRK